MSWEIASFFLRRLKNIAFSHKRTSETSDTQSRALLLLYTVYWKCTDFTMLVQDVCCRGFDFLSRMLFLRVVSHALWIELSSLQIPACVFQGTRRKTQSRVIQNNSGLKSWYKWNSETSAGLYSSVETSPKMISGKCQEIFRVPFPFFFW